MHLASMKRSQVVRFLQGRAVAAARPIADLWMTESLLPETLPPPLRQDVKNKAKVDNG
jgi:hypothetical protein